MSKETGIVVGSPSAVTTQENFASMAQDMGISVKDITLPRIFLTQSGSPFIHEANDKLKLGDIIVNTDYQPIADTNKHVEVVPVRLWKTWIEYKKVGNDKEYVQMYPVTAQNERQKWDDINEMGETIVRDYCLNFFVVPKVELTNGTAALPYVITFKRSSLQAGKVIASQMATSMAFGKAPYSNSILLSSAKPTVEKGKSAFSVYVARKGSMLTLAEMEKAKELAMLCSSLQSKAGYEDTSYVAVKENTQLVESAIAANCEEDVI